MGAFEGQEKALSGCQIGVAVFRIQQCSACGEYIVHGKVPQPTCYWQLGNLTSQYSAVEKGAFGVQCSACQIDTAQDQKCSALEVFTV